MGAHAIQIGIFGRFGGGAAAALPQCSAELATTFGLVLTIPRGVKVWRRLIRGMIGLYIMAAFWFIASTSFANPA